MRELKTKTPKESHVTMTEMILPQHTNALDTAFGGTIMSWADIAASICAMKHCEAQVVTASVDALHFLAPIKRGWTSRLLASVNFVANSSVEVGVKVLGENPISGESVHTASAYFTMVCLDQSGKPLRVNRLQPETDEEKKRYDAAKMRRENRLELRNRIKQRKAQKPVL